MNHDRPLATPLRPKPLSRVERQWINDLQAVLARCPRRLELVTISDSSLQVIDGSLARGVDLHDGLARANGLVLADIAGGPKVHGVSG